jgi:hypothetical protein
MSRTIAVRIGADLATPAGSVHGWLRGPPYRAEEMRCGRWVTWA